MQPALPLNVTLTWDLLVIVFAAVITTYSFIVGRKESYKIILATYVAAVAVHAASGLLSWLLGHSEHLLVLLGLPSQAPLIGAIRLLLFVACIIVLTIRGGISVDMEEIGGLADIAFTAGAGFATAGLLLVILLTSIAGSPLLDPAMSTSPTLVPLLAQSRLAMALAEQQAFWFCLPAGLLIANGILSAKNED